MPRNILKEEAAISKQAAQTQPGLVTRDARYNGEGTRAKNAALPDSHHHAPSGHQNNKHAHHAHAHTRPWTCTESPAATPAQQRPGAAAWASQPSSAQADALPVRGRTNPGSGSHVLPPAGLGAHEALGGRAARRGLAVEGEGEVGRETRARRQLTRTEPATGSTGPEGRQAQVRPASGRPKPQR